MLSNRPGETVEPVTATRIGWNACRGFWPTRSARSRSACSIASAVNGSTPASVSSAAASTSGRASLGFHRFCVVAVPALEQEAGEVGELAEPLDLLLDERRRSADPLLGPVDRPARAR